MDQLSNGVYKCKALITYAYQAIVSVHDMSKSEGTNTVDKVMMCLSNADSVNVLLVPDSIGDQVNAYYGIVKMCYGLVQQRHFLSRDTSVFKFVKE